jgi:ABC-type multidrug transport system ATPase subunit
VARSFLDALTRGSLQDEVCKICLETGQTVFLITHDVDEAIYLADKIVLMTNGPDARIAEIAVNPLSKTRKRGEVHHEPAYYAVPELGSPASAALQPGNPAGKRCCEWHAGSNDSGRHRREPRGERRPHFYVLKEESS